LPPTAGADARRRLRGSPPLSGKRESSWNPLACDGPAHGRSLSTLSGLSRKLRTKSDKKILDGDKETNAECGTGMGKEKWQMTNAGWQMADGKCRDETGRPRFPGYQKVDGRLR